MLFRSAHRHHALSPRQRLPRRGAHPARHPRRARFGAPRISPVTTVSSALLDGGGPQGLVLTTSLLPACLRGGRRKRMPGHAATLVLPSPFQSPTTGTSPVPYGILSGEAIRPGFPSQAPATTDIDRGVVRKASIRVCPIPMAGIKRLSEFGTENSAVSAAEQPVGRRSLGGVSQRLTS